MSTSATLVITPCGQDTDYSFIPITSRIHMFVVDDERRVRLLGYCFTPYQRLRLYNGAPFSRLLRHAGDTEDVFSA